MKKVNDLQKVEHHFKFLPLKKGRYSINEQVSQKGICFHTMALLTFIGFTFIFILPSQAYSKCLPELSLNLLIHKNKELNLLTLVTIRDTNSTPKSTDTLPKNSGLLTKLEDNKVYVSVQTYPTYPGGESELFYDLYKNLRDNYPRKAQENKIQGRVIIGFIVEKDGSISTIQVLHGNELGGGLAKAALNAVKGLQTFTPGLQNGEPVRVSFTIPITFKLDGNERKSDSN